MFLKCSFHGFHLIIFFPNSWNKIFNIIIKCIVVWMLLSMEKKILLKVKRNLFDFSLFSGFGDCVEETAR